MGSLALLLTLFCTALTYAIMTDKNSSSRKCPRVDLVAAMKIAPPTNEERANARKIIDEKRKTEAGRRSAFGCVKNFLTYNKTAQEAMSRGWDATEERYENLLIHQARWKAAKSSSSSAQERNITRSTKKILHWWGEEQMEINLAQAQDGPLACLEQASFPR